MHYALDQMIATDTKFECSFIIPIFHMSLVVYEGLRE